MWGRLPTAVRILPFEVRRPSAPPNGWPMCPHSGRGGLTAGEAGAVSTIGLLGMLIRSLRRHLHVELRLRVIGNHFDGLTEHLDCPLPDLTSAVT